MYELKSKGNKIQTNDKIPQQISLVQGISLQWFVSFRFRCVINVYSNGELQHVTKFSLI